MRFRPGPDHQFDVDNTYTLRRDRDNEYDRNAIQIWCNDDTHVAFVSREGAQRYAARLDAGARLTLLGPIDVGPAHARFEVMDETSIEANWEIADEMFGM